MTLDPPREPEGPDGPDHGGPHGSLRPTPPAVIGGSAIVGLVLGWLVHAVTARTGVPPLVGWLPSLTLLFVDAVLGATTWFTWRALQRRHGTLTAGEAVNRLALAKACVMAGALVGGGYAGYALSWLGNGAELAGPRMLHSAVAALAGAAMVTIALLLERACRVRSDDHEP